MQTISNIISSPIYSFIKDTLTFVLTISGAVIASVGLATWKKQIKGTKAFDTAYNLNYSILKLREAIKDVRNPAIWPNESSKAKQYIKEKHPEKTEEDLVNEAHINVYEMRWDKIINASIEMESHLLAAEVLWDSEILDLVIPLRKKVNELNIAIRQHFYPELRTKDPSIIFNTVYDQSIEKEEDEFSKDISKIINNVNNYLKEKIS